MRERQEGQRLGRRIAIEVMVIAAIGMALAVLGPFGSYAVPFGARAVHWIGFILAGYVIFRPMLMVAQWLSQASGIGPFAAQIVALTLGSVPLSILIGSFLNRLMPPVADAPVERYLQVWGIGFAVTLFMNRFLHSSGTSAPPAGPELETPAPSKPPRSRFLDRLPASVGPQLLCLSMEDHYVRAHGTMGSALLLMRMSDAVLELEGVPGLQVHRSWWVARDAVELVERDGDRMRLRLVNGLVVPVARSQTGAVRAQGWRSP
jgi:hypothetical protein